MVGVACPDRMPELIHVFSTVIGSDDDVTLRGNMTASDFCGRIDHPVVDG